MRIILIAIKIIGATIIMVDEMVRVGIGERPVFFLVSLSITVLLGTKNWTPSNTFQIPIPKASVLVSVYRVGV